MRDFSKKRRGPLASLARFCASAAGLGLLVLVAFVTTRAAWGMYEKFSRAAGEHAKAQREYEELGAKESRIEGAVAALSSARGVEAEIRSRFGVAKPGEGEIKIVRDESAQEEAAQNQGLWDWIVETFFVW
jgi:cell division protein FtsB